MALAKLNGLGAIFSLLYPPVCTICTEPVATGEYLCEACDDKVVRIAGKNKDGFFIFENLPADLNRMIEPNERGGGSSIQNHKGVPFLA